MNEKVEKALQQLIEAVIDSPVYKEYDLQKNKVKQIPNLKHQIDEFRARNYEMQSHGDWAFDKLEQFEREYDDFLENHMVSDFLTAELAFCRMMQRINLYITESINFE